MCVFNLPFMLYFYFTLPLDAAVPKSLVRSRLNNVLIPTLQFMGVHISNATLTLLAGAPGNAFSLIASTAELHADGAAGGPARALAFSANLVGATGRIVLTDSQKCLGEASCSLLVEGTVKADGPLNVEVRFGCKFFFSVVCR